MQAAILIGGPGTRLRPFTLNTPKSLLPIANRPFVWYQLHALRKAGISDITLCLSYKAGQYKQIVPRLKIRGLKIRYMCEKTPLGTGGAVKLLEPFQKGPLMVLNGDTLSAIDYKGLIAFHNKNRAGITLTLVPVKDPTIYGLIETDGQGRVKRFMEKPSPDEVTVNTINAGVYIFSPGTLKYIPPGAPYSLERGLFPHALELDLRLYGWTDSGYWTDIGTVEKFLQANMDLLEGKTNFSLPGKIVGPGMRSEKNLKPGKGIAVSGKVLFGSNCAVGDRVKFSGGVIAGNNVKIGREAVLENCVILPGTKIGGQARLQNCVIGHNCIIGSNVSIGRQGAVADDSRIGEYSQL